MEASPRPPFRLGDWRVEPTLGQLHHNNGDEPITLEPRVMELLLLLVERADEVVSRPQIEQTLWGQVVVGEDTVARTVSKLRRALGDAAKAPQYIDTLPKRGYRLIAPVAPLGHPVEEECLPIRPPRRGLIALGLAAVAVLLVVGLTWRPPQPPQGEAPTANPPSDAALLTARADDRYMRFTRADNEAAIVLYERALADDASYGPAHAGLANALVQRVIRWPPSSPSPDAQASTLQEALARGLPQTPQAQEILTRATAMAERAARLSPDDADVLKALGLTYAIQGDLDRAASTYRRAIAEDPNAWESMINLGEVFLIRGQPAEAAATFGQAFDAMEREYAEAPQRVGPWQGAVGVAVGKLQDSLGHHEEAELWYRRVLEKYPLDPEATRHLARLLESAGDPAQAAQLCRNLAARLGDQAGCAVSAEQPPAQ